MCIRIGKGASVIEGNLEFAVLTVEIVLQAVEIAGAFPLAHRQVVKQIVAASLWLSGRHLVLCKNPLETLNG